MWGKSNQFHPRLIDAYQLLYWNVGLAFHLDLDSVNIKDLIELHHSLLKLRKALIKLI